MGNEKKEHCFSIDYLLKRSDPVKPRNWKPAKSFFQERGEEEDVYSSATTSAGSKRRSDGKRDIVTHCQVPLKRGSGDLSESPEGPDCEGPTSERISKYPRRFDLNYYTQICERYPLFRNLRVDNFDAIRPSKLATVPHERSAVYNSLCQLADGSGYRSKLEAEGVIYSNRYRHEEGHARYGKGIPETGREWLSPNEDAGDEANGETGAETDENGRQEEQERVSRNGIKLYLQNSGLWREFHESGTEMIINRTGRRMFPRLCVQVTGLDPNASYAVSIGFQKLDRRRYKFVNGQWLATQTVDCQENSRVYDHPESPKTGDHWMKSSISFSKLKITNNSDAEGSHVYLQSMFKYAPHVIISELRSVSATDPAPPAGSSGNEVHDFTFPVTSFIAVTAYQNEKITCLKIKNNPFAKAFRESDKNDQYHNYGRYYQQGQCPHPLYPSERAASSLNSHQASTSLYNRLADRSQQMTLSNYNWLSPRGNHLSLATSRYFRPAHSLRMAPYSFKIVEAHGPSSLRVSSTYPEDEI